MKKRFDFVNVDPTVGFTKANISTIRSRAAKNDPFGPKDSKKPNKKPPPQSRSRGPTAAAPQQASRSVAFRLKDETADLEELEALEEFDEEIRIVNYRRQYPNEETTQNSWSEWDSSSSSEGEEGSRTVSKSLPRYPKHLSLFGAAQHDPFWAMPIPYQPFLPHIWNHQLIHLAPFVPDLDDEGERNLRRWFSIGFTEPAHLYSHLAFAASHLASTGAGASIVRPADILHLKACALSLINQALRDPDPARATSDAMISAVMILAGHELVFGDNESYVAHMTGCQRMIALRGGIENLDPFFQKLLLWIRNSDACWKIHWPLDRGVDVRSTLDNTAKELALRKKARDEAKPSAWKNIPGVQKRTIFDKTWASIYNQ